MLDRQVAPPVQPLASVTLPAADVLILPNGARLHVMRSDAQPVVRLQVVFKAGKWYEPAPGVALLTARLLLEGTRTRTARQIADEVAFYGASLECEQGFDRATLTLYCLARHLGKLLPLVQDVVSAPIFPEEELALLKQRTIQNIRIERQKTSYLAAERFSRNLFGSGHPYGTVFDETIFRTITRETLAQFHASTYRMAEAEIFLCGLITPEQQNAVAASLGEIITEHTVGKTSVINLSGNHTLAANHVQVDGSIQSSLRIGRLWPNLNHPSAHKLQVLIKVLGGYFGSRLMKNIREDKGFTYGIYASLTSREQSSALVIGTDVNAASTQATIQEIHYELNRLRYELIPVEELVIVKNYMSGKFANELSTVFEQCDKYKNLIFFNLADNYYSDFIEQINKVTSEEILELAQEYLSPTSLIQVIAGPLNFNYLNLF